MAALNDDVKVYIVTALACFDEPKQVAKDVKEKFGVDVYQQQLTAYDPSNAAGKRMSKKLREHFQTTREQFLADTSRIPIANAAVRLRTLQRLVKNAEERGNASMVASLLEQAAKEVGGAFTNRQKVEATGVVGSMQVPVPQSQASVAPDEAYRKMLGR